MDKHSKKSSSLLHYPVLVVFSLFFLGLFALDLITPDRAYSEMVISTAYVVGSTNSPFLYFNF